MRLTARPPLILLGAAALSLLAACGDERPPLAQNLSADALPSTANAARGRQLVSNHGCLACHSVPTVRGPASAVGPPLDNLGRQAYLTGLLPNTPANLVRWLMDPPAINPRTAMPNVGLSQAESQDIAAFLLSLPKGQEAQ
ncbi:c-type cytochrome [Achromobacter spanius]|uniref:c-type cytochrome n=1 Tax=Achromobacter spanius TaxID=217203 RepID=UPI001CB99F3B|nr:c-type cytochrome [Achromobacter spanius]